MSSLPGGRFASRGRARRRSTPSTTRYAHAAARLGAQAARVAAAAPAAPGAPGDVSTMGAAELAALQAEALTDDQLEQAFQAAHKIDAEELAAAFARALTARPPRPDRPDRFA